MQKYTHTSITRRGAATGVLIVTLMALSTIHIENNSLVSMETISGVVTTFESVNILPRASVAQNYSAWADQGIIYTAPAGDAYYPSVLFETDGFEDSNIKYTMWYTDGSGAVFIITSSNGLLWSAPTTINGLGDDAHHVQVLYDANHFGLGIMGPKYRMWYWDINADLYSIASIATAQSIDGINWINDTTLTQETMAQLVTGAGSGWNRGTYGPVSLKYNLNALNMGTDPWNYSYTMYYDGTDGSHEQIGLAYSADGIFWKAYEGNPVLPHSVSLTWDSTYTSYGSIYRDIIGYHMWYSGGISAASEGIGYAFSIDGKIWNKNNNTIFHITDGIIYRNKRAYTPSIINDGTGVLKMYYTAQATDGPKNIGSAILTLKENIPPTVISTIPANNDAHISLDSTLSAIFSETMDPLTITPLPLL